MQQAAQAPVVPQTQQPVRVEFLTQQAGQQLRPLTNREISAIRDRRSDMSDQLTSAVRRRDNLANDLKDAPAGTEQGILARIQLLDQRILQIESDIESSGQMIRSGMTVDNGVALVAPAPPQPLGLSQDNITALGLAFSAFFLLPLAIGSMRLMFRRARRREMQPAADMTARFEQLEQAIDAVAIEIERVGEAQRFQARVLSEANMMPALSEAHGSAEPIPLREYERSRRYPDAAP
jgi:hypothetical protein